MLSGATAVAEHCIEKTFLGEGGEEAEKTGVRACMSVSM